MRTRLFLVLVAVALVAPVTVLSAAQPAGAATVSTTASWTDTTSGWYRGSSPTIADVNGDGRREIVIGHENGLLHVINAANGHDLPGWPQQTGTAIDSTPAVGDLFRNGGREVVVGLGSQFVKNQQGGLVVYNSNGSLHCRFRTLDYFNVWTGNGPADGYADGVFSSPALGDVNGDGYPDIVFGSFDHHVRAIDRNCRELMSDDLEDTTWSSPALYDVNGDGRMEILIGGDQTAGGYINWAGGEFRVIQYTTGNSIDCVHCHEIWKHQLLDAVQSSPAIGDVDGDGRPEVVVVGGDYYNRTTGHQVFAWHLDDGSNVRGWPVATAGSETSSVALGDLTGNGVPEVVVPGADGWVRAYNGNGSQKWATYLPAYPGQAGGPATSPIVADFNGDGRNDVGAGNRFGFYSLNGSNGAVIATVDRFMARENAAAVGDFGSGVGWRLVVSGFNSPNNTSHLQAYAMPTPRTPVPWAMFRHDSSHKGGPVARHLFPPGQCRASGNPPSHPSTASSHGYWVLGADGGIYALKGAPFYGSAAGHVRGTAVSMVATHSGHGYYLLDNSGDIFPFGDAKSLGSMAGRHLNAPITTLAPTPSGRGYWLMASDGGVFSFGDARFYGSMGAVRLNKPVISMAATSTGRGYWLLASDGGVFSFGDARFHGSTGNLRLNSPVISMATAPSGRGYWLVARDGGIFSFGVPFYGSIPGLGLCQSAQGVQIRPSLTGEGYFAVTLDGRVYAFGDALAGATALGLGGWNFAVDLAVRP